jgi:hypothetical protein
VVRSGDGDKAELGETKADSGIRIQIFHFQFQTCTLLNDFNTAIIIVLLLTCDNSTYKVREKYIPIKYSIKFA